MGWKMLLEILWISAQNNGFSNTRAKATNMVSFTDGWIITRDGAMFNLKNFEGDNKINVDINTDNAITPDSIKYIKMFLHDEFSFDV